MGWWIGDTGNKWMGPAVYWNGDTANFHTFFRYLPKLGLGAFVSVNTSTAVQVHEEVGLRALGLMVTAKTGRTAPTPPRPAPAVKVPVRTLRRAAGQYASSSSGLYTLSVAGDGLKLSPTPPSPVFAPVKYLPRADGWYAAAQVSTDNPFSSAWIKPATVAGRHLLLAHGDKLSGTEPNGVVTTLGEKIPPDYRIPRAWRARVGTYRATNIVPGSAALVSPVVELRIVRGVLEWDGLALSFEGPRAFTYGLTSWLLARGEGDSLVPSGKTLTILGVHYRKAATGAGAARPAAAAASALAEAPIDAPAQETTPVAGSVIAAPEPVLASNGRNELAYELQLINRSESTVTVKKVEALAGGKVVEQLSGKSLEAVMQPYGQSTTSEKLAPGEAGFVLMDVSLARKAKIPAELTHRIVISTKPKPTIASAMSYELAPTQVSRRKAIVIHPPLYGPGWVINSGCCSVVNAHRGVQWPVNGKIVAAERFAIDFYQANAAGQVLDGPDDQLSSYVYYGAEVHSATAGKVVSVRNDMPEAPLENLPPGLSLEEGAGNKVVVAAGHGRYVFYAHLQHGSVTVHPGDRVKVGQTIGLLGNSGNSAGPHLHFQVMNGPLSAGSNGMPFRFTQFNLQGTVKELNQETAAVTVDRSEHGIHRDELPLDQQMVEFAGT